MIKIMSSKHQNGNGHVGVEMFARWYLGFYFYPESQEYSLSVARRGEVPRDLWRLVIGSAIRKRVLSERGMTGVEVIIVMALLSLVSAGMMRTESKVRATNRENSLLRYDRKSARCEPSGWLWRDMECTEPKLLDWCPEVAPAPQPDRDGGVR